MNNLNIGRWVQFIFIYMWNVWIVKSNNRNLFILWVWIVANKFNRQSNIFMTLKILCYRIKYKIWKTWKYNRELFILIWRLYCIIYEREVWVIWYPVGWNIILSGSNIPSNYVIIVWSILVPAIPSLFHLCSIKFIILSSRSF